MASALQKEFQFSNYQMAQLRYFFLSMLSEASKLVLLAVFFRAKLPLFCFAVLAMLFLRTANSGIHLHHYLSCLAFSFAYFYLLLRILADISPAKMVQLPCLLACCALIFWIGPLPSKIHLKMKEDVLKRLRIRAALIAFLYTLACLLLPASIYTTVVFWVVVLHTAQLLIAKILRKGDETK